MTAMEFLISVVESSGGTVQGRTLLQKLCFFVSRLTTVDAQLGFDAHFYGPYSSTVDTTVLQLKSIGLIREENNAYGIYSGGFEIKRYDYSLTPEGKKIAERIARTEEFKQIKVAFERIEAAGGLDYVSLSFAAKVFFILTKRGLPMSREAIQREAPSFNWNIPDDSTKRAIDFLGNVGLISASKVQ